MQIAGDADACLRAGQALMRAAGVVAEQTERLDAARCALPEWTGTAAQRWSGLAAPQVRSGRATADRMAAAGHAFLAHADALEELQQRARRLAGDAREDGLHLAADGSIAPVAVPVGPPIGLEQERARQEALRRAARRELLLARVALVRADETVAHERLAVALRTLQIGSPAVALPDVALPGGVSWTPGWWDLPPAIPSVASEAAKLVPAGWPAGAPRLSRVGVPVLKVVRNVPGMSVLGFGTGVVIDVQVNDVPIAHAAGRNAVGAAAGTTAMLIVGGVGTVVGATGAPVIVPAIVVGTVIGYAGGKAYDWLVGRRSAPARRGSTPRPSPTRAIPVLGPPTGIPSVPRLLPGTVPVLAR